ncbi:MAG TPA: 4-alpha-glucanotransferase [Myxococcota bacterium]|nr:4-alpha-glucanotransferase [Myxococcota bacterium]
MSEARTTLLAEARGVLGVGRLAFGIQDASLPGDPDTDLGHGSPYGAAAHALLTFLRDLGFDVLQLGPQGEISAGNPSPYDGAAFSRRATSADVALLADASWGRLLAPDTLAAWVEQRPADASTRVPYAFSRRAQTALMRAAGQTLGADADGDGSGDAAERACLRRALGAFRERNARWLGRDALFEQLEREHPGAAWQDWGDPDGRLLHPEPAERGAFAGRRQALEAAFRDEIEAHAFVQFVVHEQHRRFRDALSRLGMRVWGDLQIGLSGRDAWAFRPWLLRGYRLGAPPSRTNPDGQPWGYPVLDPSHLLGPRDGPGPALRLVAERMEKLFDEYDGLRIDHPHGLVCPWVYRADDPDPVHAVQSGARLFAAPDLPDHPGLARYAIARREQLADDPAVARWDEHWVRRLDPDQVSRYAAVFDAVVAAARHHGRGPEDLACEVLSTLPHPLARVLARHGLGRFRVTQKLDPDDPDDPYRLEHTAPADWVMIGTHDTAPLWQLLEAWSPAHVEARARYAAALLEPEAGRRPTIAGMLARDRGLLAQALLAELLACRAENVMVFFTDLFGLTAPFNRPGTVSGENWSLRLPPDWRDEYRERLRTHRALNLPLAFALALRARGARPDLQAALAAEAARLAPLPPAWQEALGAAAP